MSVALSGASDWPFALRLNLTCCSQSRMVAYPHSPNLFTKVSTSSSIRSLSSQTNPQNDPSSEAITQRPKTYKHSHSYINCLPSFSTCLLSVDTIRWRTGRDCANSLMATTPSSSSFSASESQSAALIFFCRSKILNNSFLT